MDDQKRTLTSEIQLHFGEAIQNAQAMALELDKLATAATRLGGVIDTKGLEEGLRDLQRLFRSGDGGELTAKGFDRLRQNINKAIAEAVGRVYIQFDPKEVEEMLKVHILKKTTSTINTKLKAAINEALSNLDVPSASFKIEITPAALTTLNAALNRALSAAMEKKVDISDFRVLADGKSEPIRLRITSANFQRMIDAVRDEFFRMLADDRIIQLDGMDGVQPFHVNSTVLREAIARVQTALTKVAEQLDVDLQGLQQLDTVAVDLTKFKSGIARVMSQVKQVADALNQIDFKGGADQRSLTEIQNALRSLHTDLVTRIRTMITDIDASLRQASTDSSSQQFAALMNQASSLIQDHLLAEMNDAIDALRTALGYVRTAGNGGQEVWVRGVRSINNQIAQSFSDTVSQIIRETDFGFDATNMVNIIRQFGASTVERMENVTNIELNRIATEFITANQRILDSIRAAISKVASVAISEQAIAENRITVDIPIEELRKLVAPKLQEAVTLLTRTAIINNDLGSSDFSVNIDIPQATLNRLNNVIRGFIETQAARMVEQIQGFSGAALSEADTRSLDRALRVESRKVLDLIVGKTRGIIQVFVDGVNDDSIAAFNATERRAINNAIKQSITQTIQHMSRAIQSAFSAFITSDDAASALGASAVRELANGADAILLRYANSVVNEAKKINNQLAAQFRVNVDDLHANVRRILANQFGFRTIRELRERMPVFEGPEGMNTVLTAHMKMVMDSFNEALLRNLTSHIQSARDALRADIPIDPVHRDTFISTLTGLMNRLMEEVIRKMTTEIASQFQVLMQQVKTVGFPNVSLGSEVANEIAKRQTRRSRRAGGDGEVSVGERPDTRLESFTDRPVPYGSREFPNLSAYEKIALTQAENVINRFRDSKLSPEHMDELRDYMFNRFYSDVRDAVADYEMAREMGDRDAFIRFRDQMRDLNLEMRYVVEQFRALLSEDKRGVQESLRGRLLGTNELFRSQVIPSQDFITALRGIDALRQYEILAASVNDKTGTWNSRVRDAEGNVYRLSGSINKATGELYQHGEAISLVTRKTQELAQASARIMRTSFDYASAYGLDAMDVQAVPRRHWFLTSVINTMRYITAGALIGTPTWMLHSAFRDYRDFEYELAKAQANFLVDNPDMTQIAAERLTARGALPGTREEAESAIREEASRLQKAARGGLARNLQDLAFFYGVNLGDVGAAFQIASRRINDPYSAFEFTRQVTKFRAIEEVDVETAAQGLEAVVSQWGITGDMLSKTADMLILAANITQAKVEDLLATQQRAGAVMRSNLPGMSLEEQLASSIALSSVFVQATARSGAEGGTLFRNITERPYNTRGAAMLREINRLPQLRDLNLDPYDENGMQRNFIEVFGAFMEANKRLRNDKAGRVALLNALSTMWHIGSVSAIEQFFADYEAQINRIQAVNEELARLGVTTGQDTRIRPNMSSEDVLRLYIDNIRNADEETTAMIQASTMGTYKFRTAALSTMWSSAAGNVFGELEDEFAQLATFLSSLLRGVRNNADTVADLLQTITTYALAFGIRWFAANKIPQYLENRRQDRLASTFDEIRGRMLLEGRALDLQRQFIERTVTPENAARMAPIAAQVAAQSIMFNRRLNALQFNMRELGVSEERVPTKVAQLPTSFSNLQIEADLVEKELQQLNRTAGITDRTFTSLQRKLDRLNKEFRDGRIDADRYNKELQSLQREFIAADAGIATNLAAGDSIGLTTALAVAAGASVAGLDYRTDSRTLRQRITDAYRMRSLRGITGGLGAPVRDESGNIMRDESGRPVFFADIAEQATGQRPPTRRQRWLSQAGRFARTAGTTTLIAGGISATTGRVSRLGASEAELVELDAQTARQIIRMGNTVNNRDANWFEKTLAFAGLGFSYMNNILTGNKANEMVKGLGRYSEAEALARIERQVIQARMEQARELFEIDPTQAFLYDEKGRIIDTKYSRITTTEEAETLISEMSKRLSTNLGLASGQFEITRTRRLISGYREDSEEIIKLTNEFLDKQIELLRGAVREIQKEMDRIEEEGGKDSDAYRTLEARRLELELQAEQSALQKINTNLSRVSNIRSQLDFNLQRTELEGALRRADLLLSGASEDSPGFRRLEMQLAQELNRQIAEQLPRLQAELDAMRGREDTDEYRDLWLQIKELQVEQKENLVQIRKALTNSLSTFNLPAGITAMTYYEALTESGSHRNYSIVRGDTVINITVGSVNDEATIKKIEDAVVGAVNRGNMADDVKRLSSAPFSPIGGGTS